MTLTITQQNKVSLIQGHINKATVTHFKNHLEFLLLYSKQLVIDINDVKEIDASGMSALQALYTYAKTHNKTFYVVGTGCKEIQEHFEYNHAA